MKKFTVAVVAVLSAALLFSQTRVHMDQVRGPSVTDARVLVLANGRMTFASVGAGVQMVATGSGFELRGTFVAPTESSLQRAADGSWTLPAGCNLLTVYRNGLRQLRTADYTVSGTVVRFKDGTADPSLPDDVVVAECR